MLSPVEIRRLKRKSYVLGLGVFLIDATVYTLAIWGTIAAPYLVARLACSLIAGIFTALLFTVGHDACHQSLTPSRWLNRLLGTLAFLPSLNSYSLWEHGHNHLHHLFTNQRGKDSNWEPLSFREYRLLPWWSRLRYRFFRTYVGHFFYYACETWFWRRVFPRQVDVGQIRARHWSDCLIVVTWLAAMSATVVALRAMSDGRAIGELAGWPEPLWLAIVGPFLIGSMSMSRSTYLQHTHPSVHWYAEPPEGNWTDHQVRTTIHVQFPAPVDGFMHWIMDHTAHHMQPSIPLYHLSEAQQLVEADRPEEVFAYPGSFRESLRILRACKLYDIDVGCWTDYSGRPTSESRRPAQPVPTISYAPTAKAA